MDSQKAPELQTTDLNLWRLKVDEYGNHHWSDFNHDDGAFKNEPPQTFAEKYFLGLPTNAFDLPAPQSFRQAASDGLSFYSMLQLEDGHWGCSYGGPSFLLPGIVFAMYITGKSIPTEWSIEMTRYICHHVNEDGGWGLYTAGPTTVFATVLYYVTLRILGVHKDHPVATKARERLLELGGALLAPQWGRYWLAALNLFEWEGVQPVPPEIWLLPKWLPIHPWRWWVQCRSVYVPVSYLYSNKCKTEWNALLKELREEIYADPYESIDFASNQDNVATTDRKRPLSPFLSAVNSCIRLWEQQFRPSWLHKWANKEVRQLMRREDLNTQYNDIAPVSKAFHTVAVYFCDGPDSPALKIHHQKILPYLWQGSDGMNCGGTNGTQLWDTAFSVIAIAEAGLAKEPWFRPTLEKALMFLNTSQFRDDLEDPYRQRRKGGWPFSTWDQSYIVSDCAAEGMKATLLLQEE